MGPHLSGQADKADRDGWPTRTRYGPERAGHGDRAKGYGAREGLGLEERWRSVAGCKGWMDTLYLLVGPKITKGQILLEPRPLAHGAHRPRVEIV